MEPHERDVLDRVLELSEENNRILKKMERMARWTTIFKVAYWGLIAAAAIGLYYYIQPYVDGVIELYGGVKNAISGVAETMGNTPR